MFNIEFFWSIDEDHSSKAKISRINKDIKILLNH